MKLLTAQAKIVALDVMLQKYPSMNNKSSNSN